MIIKTNSRDITVSSVVSTSIRKGGKSYPALKFMFGGEISADDLTALTSGEIAVNGTTHEGYNTLGEIAVTVGMITTAEEERNALESELTTMRAEHEEYKGAVETILPKLDDEAALSVKAIFPTWEKCVSLGTIESDVGYRFVCNGELYKCKSKNPVFRSDWIPGSGTESLYERIDVTHAGTSEDPIPYDGNMALENGKYYSQDGVIYICNRDTGNPVYNSLSELIGIYVERAE